MAQIRLFFVFRDVILKMLREICSNLILTWHVYNHLKISTFSKAVKSPSLITFKARIIIKITSVILYILQNKKQSN